MVVAPSTRGFDCRGRRVCWIDFVLHSITLTYTGSLFSWGVPQSYVDSDWGSPYLWRPQIYMTQQMVVRLSMLCPTTPLYRETRGIKGVWLKESTPIVGNLIISSDIIIEYWIVIRKWHSYTWIHTEIPTVYKAHPCILRNFVLCSCVHA